jgi:putative spermidine/putrescine transport system permease protein
MTLLSLQPAEVIGGGGMIMAEKVRGVDWGRLTLANYLHLVRDRHYLTTLANSLVISLFVSVLSIVLCMAPAWLLIRKEFPGKRVLRAVLTIPMAFSGVIIGFLAVVMLGMAGAVPETARALFGVPVGRGLAYSLTGLVLAYIYFPIPRATLNLESAVRKFDWDLDAAARSLGASPWYRLRYVLVPLLMPAIISTMAVTFAVSMGSFGVALILLKKLSVLPVEVYLQMYTALDFEFAATMSVVLSVTTLAANLVLRRYGERHYAFR